MRTSRLDQRRRPLTCLVTDRRRWTGAARETSGLEEVLHRVRVAVAAGVDVIQIREPDLTARDLLTLVEACVQIAGSSDTMVVVNERTDVALAGGADGVHLRAASLPGTAVRRLVPPGFVVGRSVHQPADLLGGLAEGVDYLLAGTVFASRSKPADHPRLGPDGLAAVIRLAHVPVLAIGGVSIANAATVAASGAAGVAAIGFLGEAARSVASCARALEALRQEYQGHG